MSAAEPVRAALARIAAADRPEIWIALRCEPDLLAEAAALDAQPDGERGELYGLTVAVKDNVDVAGLPTTAACSAFSYMPTTTATAVQRLVDAGAIVLGKTNLDQFATGLVGTRSPYGAVRDARRPEYVSGGSSSGSGAAVALGLVDLAVGTDTAGSGRVPAAFGGIVGFKATRNVVPTDGVVPACATLDCVTVFAPDLALAERAIAIMGDALPPDAPLAAPPAPRVAVPPPEQLGDLTEEARAAFARAADTLEAAGAVLQHVGLAPFLEAARLLYDGALVAERHAAVGAFVETHGDDVDPTVGAIVAAAGRFTATEYLKDMERVAELRAAALASLDGADAMLLPTTTRQPTIAEVAADPVGANSRLGIYTNFCNLFDLCAVAVPAGEADGGQFGVTVLAPAHHDRVAADVAALLTGTSLSAPAGIELLVVGAHRRGQPLNHQLTSRGARFAEVCETAPTYRLHALPTTPPKPGLVRVDTDGAPIEGELWMLNPAALGTFLAELPPPMTLGPVTLADGRTVVGFGVEPSAVEGTPDITHHGSWPAYLAASAAAAPA
ncbi:allophanate hydrolase [Conexibacter woesei]|uniref:allophanate hydrolase n=1 Tax=Conexibacter woesei TaxID=191495 RepID=UPI000424AF7E|nr:allophanate hydrolase [Conexibacter woesei]